MSTGSYDFIDEAVEAMRRGKHPFALIALDGTRYSVRAGAFTPKEWRRLRRVADERLRPILDNEGARPD